MVDLIGEFNRQLGPSLYFSAVGPSHYIELNRVLCCVTGRHFFANDGVNVMAKTDSVSQIGAAQWVG